MTSALWEATAELVHRRTGLVFPEGRRRTLEDGVARIMRRNRIGDPQALVRQLESQAALLDELVSEITVGETYFFRHPEQIAVIRNRILPALLRETRDRPLRMWSAGCATGEEPYTLAILAWEMGITDRVRILGTDLSRHALRVARRGRYRPWSLRGTPAEIRNRHFTEENGTLTLSPAIRDLVDLRYLNLAEDVYPALSTQVWGMDLVLCRNVLIYFDAETGGEVAGRLLESLSEPGWLVVGASDPLLSQWAPAAVVQTDAGLAYRRPATAPTPPSPPGATPPPPPTTFVATSEVSSRASPGPPGSPPRESVEIPSPPAFPPSLGEKARARYAARDYREAADLAQEALSATSHDAELWVLLVRSLANLGRMRDAARFCTAAAEHHSTDPELAYLEAVLFANLDRPVDSVRAARRALYLDRGFVMAHLTLGSALSRLGDRGGARRSFRNAQAILGELPPQAGPPASDGEPAGRLLLLAKTQLELLEDEP